MRRSQLPGLPWVYTAPGKAAGPARPSAAGAKSSGGEGQEGEAAAGAMQGEASAKSGSSAPATPSRGKSHSARDEPGRLLELNCISLAKAACRHQGLALIGPPGNQFELRRLQHHSDERKTATSFMNGVVAISAAAGDVEHAARWMSKLDSTRGYVPSVEAFNALLRATTRRGDWTKADEWFNRPDTPVLHPELGTLQPNAESYDIMAQAAASFGDVVRAEKYMRLAKERGLKVSRKTFSRIICKLLEQREARRAHHWAHLLIIEGCCQVECYEPWVVRNEKHKLRSTQIFSPLAIYELVGEVIKGLADTGNTQTANAWLEYLVECGVNSEDYKDLWTYVRKATPLEIVPAGLSAEMYEQAIAARSPFVEAATMSPKPVAPTAPRLLPAVLSGEERLENGTFRHRARRPSRSGSARSSRQSSVDSKESSPTKGMGMAGRPSSTERPRSSSLNMLGNNMWGGGDKRSLSPDEHHASTRAPSSSSCSRPATSMSVDNRTSTTQSGSKAVAASALQEAAGAGIVSPTPGRRASLGHTRFPRGVEQQHRQKLGISRGRLHKHTGPVVQHGQGSIGLHRLLEARRHIYVADRAATARRGVDAWLSARGGRPLDDVAGVEAAPADAALQTMKSMKDVTLQTMKSMK